MGKHCYSREGISVVDSSATSEGDQEVDGYTAERNHVDAEEGSVVVKSNVTDRGNSNPVVA